MLHITLRLEHGVIREMLTTQPILTISRTGWKCIITTVPCPVQTFNLYTSNVNATTQFFGADFVADGNVPYDHFTLRFREVGATAWQFRSITAAHIAAGGRNVGGLTTAVEYEWGIRTFCGAGSTWKSPWSQVQTLLREVLLRDWLHRLLLWRCIRTHQETSLTYRLLLKKHRRLM